MDDGMPSILDVIREKTERLIKLRQEVLQLEAELGQVRTLLSTAEADRPRPRSRHGFTGGRRRRPIQEDSSVWWAQKVLEGAGGPLSADELVRRIADSSGRSVKKPTLVSNLSRYVQHKDTFVRPSPNTYALASRVEGKEETQS